jgi:hypothetical protein
MDATPSDGGGGDAQVTLPPGVTLTPIDGGPHHYADHGLTYAVKAGWDDPSFFPIAIWYGMILGQSDVLRWKDLGVNTSFAVTSNSDMSLLRNNGLNAIVSAAGGAFENPTYGSETVGFISYDEPGSMSDWEKALQTIQNSAQDGRFWTENNTWNFFAYGGISPVTSSAQVLATTVTTPNGTMRGIDLASVDCYWFAGVNAGWGYEGGLVYQLGMDMTADQIARPSHYGDMVDLLRGYEGSAARPLVQIIEDGGPYTQDTTAASYVTPPQMNAAVWSSLIHGARLIMYFNHSFAGPAQSDDNFAQTYYQTVQSGQTISIYDQAKATNALIHTLAPVLNSPTAVGYVTVSPAAVPFPGLSGIDVMAKWDSKSFTIFAEPRYSESTTNQMATFTIQNTGATQVTVVNENRTIPIINAGTQFTDLFATGDTVHIYQVP